MTRLTDSAVIVAERAVTDSPSDPALRAVTAERAEAARPGELRVERQLLEDGRFVVSVVGEVDMHTAPVLGDALDDAVDRGGAAVVVDLTPCSFLDSSGFWVLVAAKKRLRDLDRRLVVVAPNPRALGLLDLSVVNAVLEVCPSRAAALVPAREDWEDEARRRVLIRGRNEQLEQSCVGLSATRDGSYVFLCECGDRGCTSLLRLSLGEYESVRAHPARFAVACNHENPEAERVVWESGRFAVVETVTGELSRTALASNPRWQRGEPW